MMKLEMKTFGIAGTIEMYDSVCNNSLANWVYCFVVGFVSLRCFCMGPTQISCAKFVPNDNWQMTSVPEMLNVDHGIKLIIINHPIVASFQPNF